jgi:hypothetical protein
LLRLLGSFVALVVVLDAATARASHPPRAILSTARAAIVTGVGDRRIEVGIAWNREGGLCVRRRIGLRPGAPGGFTCLRRGLEPPLVAFVYGGGSGSVVAWGVITGLVAPGVTRVETKLLYGSRAVRDLPLKDVIGTGGWRAFTTGYVTHPTSVVVEALGADGSEFARFGGGALRRPVTAIPWRAVVSSLAVTGTADVNPAVSVAFADTAVAAILTAHPASLTGVTPWWNCSHRRLGSLVSFAFAPPASFTAELPAVVRPRGERDYAQRVNRVRARRWPVMTVWVDQRAEAVVGVTPLGSWIPTQAVGRTTIVARVVPPHDMGGRDSRDCWPSHG